MLGYKESEKKTNKKGIMEKVPMSWNNIRSSYSAEYVMPSIKGNDWFYDEFQ